MAKISMIAAVAENGVVGLNGQMPWRLSADLRYFKSVTMGKVVIMGRKTFESIGKPLPNRKNFIVSRRVSEPVPVALSLEEGQEAMPDCFWFSDLKSAIEVAHRLAGDNEQVMIAGGAQIYTQALGIADKLYLTEVHASPEGDAYFPQFDRTRWKEVFRERCPADEKNQYDYSFVQLERLTS